MKQSELAAVGDRLTEFVEGFVPTLGRSERRHHLPPLTEIRRWLNELMRVVICAKCGAHATCRPSIIGNSS